MLSTKRILAILLLCCLQVNFLLYMTSSSWWRGERTGYELRSAKLFLGQASWRLREPRYQRVEVHMNVNAAASKDNISKLGRGVSTQSTPTEGASTRNVPVATRSVTTPSGTSLPPRPPQAPKVDNKSSTVYSGGLNGMPMVRPSTGHVFLLVVVKTGPGEKYLKRRNLTRDLWMRRCRSGRLFGSAKMTSPKSLAVECLFLSGESNDQHITAALKREAAQHGDLYVAPFQDNYKAMTAKTQWSLLWSLIQPKTFDYILMIDDDAYVAFSNFLPWLLEKPREKFYSGHLHFNRKVVHCHRDPTHPNCIDFNLLPHAFYPPFASGFAYVLSRDAAAASVQRTVARATQGLPGNVEDAVLGMLLQESAIALQPEEGFVHWVDEHRRCPRQAVVLVVGNAPEDVLTNLARNELHGEPMCHRL